ncbi:MAG: trypsin-like peptidase domain-containing protein [Pseudomonadota bacterium]
MLWLSAAMAADDGTTANPALTAPAGLSAELMKTIRAATFEVVLKKPETDPLQYDKPPPLDLLPFTQRSDKYESIGTAFAIAPGKFVTAAHVTNVASGSLWGIPALRDAQGKVYPIDKVSRFSLDRDFIVFTATGVPQVAPLQTSTDYHFDTPVFAVGNALGQGIVVRDGTLTSETPEEQDGRWKWLRFSAPASPGNSGGPLLDAQGRVIGLISRKSANENLNFALPIAAVLNAPDNKASIDVRYTASLPIFTTHRSEKLEAGFDLPLSFADFDRQLLTITNQRVEAAQRQLLQDSVADVFPRGKSGHLLADPFLGTNPGFITQQSDGSWDVPRGSSGTSTPLGTDGYVWVNGQATSPMFHIHYASDVDVAKGRGDSKLLIEQLLKGMTLKRAVGSESVRLTSMGSAGKPEEVKDGFGRVWQVWRCPMLYADSTFMLMALPVPDGYVGFARLSSEQAVARIGAEMRLVADFLQVPYTGTLAQWRGFLADTHLRPESFGKWQASLDLAGEVSLDLPRLAVKVNKEVLNLTERSELRILPGTLLDGEHPAWDVLAVQISLEPRRSASLVAVRRARPASDAGEATLTRWNNMMQLAGQYAGKPMRDPQNFWVRKVAGADGTAATDARFFYDLSYETPTLAVQGEVLRAGSRLAEIFTVREK